MPPPARHQLTIGSISVSCFYCIKIKESHREAVDGCTTAQTQQTGAFVVVKLTVCAGLVQRRQMLNGGHRAEIVQWCISFLSIIKNILYLVINMVINIYLLIKTSFFVDYCIDIMCIIITAEAIMMLPLFLYHT